MDGPFGPALAGAWALKRDLCPSPVPLRVRSHLRRPSRGASRANPVPTERSPESRPPHSRTVAGEGRWASPRAARRLGRAEQDVPDVPAYHSFPPCAVGTLSWLKLSAIARSVSPRARWRWLRRTTACTSTASPSRPARSRLTRSRLGAELAGDHRRRSSRGTRTSQGRSPKGRSRDGTVVPGGVPSRRSFHAPDDVEVPHGLITYVQNVRLPAERWDRRSLRSVVNRGDSDSAARRDDGVCDLRALLDTRNVERQ